MANPIVTASGTYGHGAEVAKLGDASRLGAITDASGHKHRIATERITMEPFDLRDRPRYELVIDRLAYWYYLPREWLKKVALMNDVYLLNSPFVMQQAEFFAERVRKEAGADVEAQVSLAFRLAFGREPTSVERTAAARLIADHGTVVFCRALFNSNEFLYVP